jgi:RimJ/RimL family protein N-acetyltransferase
MKTKRSKAFIRINMLLKSLSKRTLLIILLTVVAIPTSYGIYRLIDRWYQATAILTEPPETVKGSVITLRLFKEEYFIDYHNMFSNAARHGLAFPEVITLGYTIQYLRSELQRVREGKMLLYAIFDNKDNVLIGTIEIRELNDIDPGQEGVWLNEKYWGGGRFQEALKLITNVYFRLHPNEKRYITYVHLWNKRSYAAHKKAGLKDVGYFYEDGKAVYYILEMPRP